MGQLAHALNEMAARVERNVAELRETARRKQQLVDNVAHELRTPLTAVGGYAQMCIRDRACTPCRTPKQGTPWSVRW